MTLLKHIHKGKDPKPPRVMLTGVEGIGKSTWAAAAPKPIFVQTEDGLDQIDCHKFPLAKSLDDVLGALSSLYTEEHPYQTVVIDSLDRLELLIWDEVCRQYGAKSIEKCDGGYGRGYVHALTHWRQVVEGLEALRNDRGMAIVLIAHVRVQRFEDPESTSYDRYTPRLHKHASALLVEWVDAVLFATRKFRTETEDAGFGRERTIAAPVGADGGERIVRTVGSPTCVAKNRFGLPAELPLEWAAFMEAMAGSQKETSN